MDITSISTQARALQQSAIREHSLETIKKQQAAQQAAADQQQAASRSQKPARSLPKRSSEYNFSVYV